MCTLMLSIYNDKCLKFYKLVEAGSDHNLFDSSTLKQAATHDT
jgi:hypothetical protein